MDIYFYFRVVASLLLVVSIFGIIIFFLKKLETVNSGSKHKEMSIIEIVPIDVKRKLVRIAYNKKRYILLLGNQDVLLDVVNEE